MLIIYLARCTFGWLGIIFPESSKSLTWWLQFAVSADGLNSGDGVVLTRHDIEKNILDASQQSRRTGSSDDLQRPRCRDQGEPLRSLISAVM